MNQTNFLLIIALAFLLAACAANAALVPTATSMTRETAAPTARSTPTITETPISDHGLLAFRALAESSGDWASTVYLLDSGDWSMRQVGEGNSTSFLWSPRGSYLVTFRTQPLSGYIQAFSIWNTDTFTHNERPYFGGMISQFLWSPDERYFVAGRGNQYGGWEFVVWHGDGSALVFEAECHECYMRSVGFRPLQWQDGQLLVDHSQWSGDAQVSLETSGLYLLDPRNSEWSLVEARDCEECWAPVAMERTEQYDNGPVRSADSVLLATAQGATLVIEEVSSGQVFTIPLPKDVTDVGPMAWSP